MGDIGAVSRQRIGGVVILMLYIRVLSQFPFLYGLVLYVYYQRCWKAHLRAGILPQRVRK